ncbi:MAG: histidinol-phosphatase [Deltaproteobacteria bacterium]|jgi:histidinol-phosphatase (PHP family)|nr:histidinol-phosphatase [Deltaproteobacteria bacterium]
MKPPLIDTSIDGHVHTKLCNHAGGEMEEYVLAAIERGLRKLIFLEHLEVGINYFESTWLTEDDFVYYHTEGKRLQDKYRGIIEIGLGIEVGYNPNFPDEIKRRLALHSWDRIGISYHFLETDSGHLNMVSRKQFNIDKLDKLGVDEVITRYYKELLEAVETLQGQVLCHIDAVLRHHPSLMFSPEHEKLVDNLLDAVARKKMALEVNTSGYRLRNKPYPSLDILKKAIKRKIPLVAGSDAHRPQDVGRYFNRLEDLMNKSAVNNSF